MDWVFAKIPLHPGLCRHNSVSYFFSQMNLRFKRIPARKKKNITTHLGSESCLCLPLALPKERPLSPHDCRGLQDPASASQFNFCMPFFQVLQVTALWSLVLCLLSFCAQPSCPASLSSTAPPWLGVIIPAAQGLALSHFCSRPRLVLAPLLY